MSGDLTLLQIRSKIFWADYYTENHKFKKFNFRKHGVTVDNDFLQALANNQFLTAQHFTFFQQLFRHYYGKQLVLSLDCYFFNEFMPDLTKQITSSMIISPIRNAAQPITQVENIQNREQNLRSSSDTYNNEEIVSTQEKQTGKIENVLNKTKTILSYLNPFAYFSKQPTKENNCENVLNKQQNNQFTFEIESEKAAQQTIQNVQLQKYNFQIQNITYVKKDPIEQDKVISKNEMRITNIVVLENEKGSFKYKKLNVLINNLCSEFQFNDSYNIFSLFRYTYVPINIQNNHWISAIVAFEEGRIQYMDSYFTQQQSNVMDGLKQMLNYKGEKMDWIITSDSPKQDNTYDCGVFCLMTLYHLYKTGKPIMNTSYTQENINNFRKQLLQLAIIESQIDIHQKLLNIILDYQYKKQ